jgi:Fe-S oxidoreductase
MGRIGDWAPIGSRISWLINGIMQTPVLSSMAKYIGGIAQERQLPRFASTSFRKGFNSKKVANSSQKKVILWVDTFCENFHPEVAHAAVEVLAHAGFQATLPSSPLCCGRPLYDFGYLDLAKQKLEKILDSLGDQIGEIDGESIALVGLEPGCMSVFKDELLKFFPDDPRAKLLASQSYLLGDFLHEQGYVPPTLDCDVLVHSHCHQKALFGTKGDVALLSALGAKADFIDSGCCGMAGSFGFNPEHIETSKAVGELVLLPAVRQTSKETIILTNGFSCREQIEQETGRKVMHLAELLQKAHQQ